jgi:hypothetical protein
MGKFALTASFEQLEELRALELNMLFHRIERILFATWNTNESLMPTFQKVNISTKPACHELTRALLNIFFISDLNGAEELIVSLFVFNEKSAKVTANLIANCKTLKRVEFHCCGNMSMLLEAFASPLEAPKSLCYFEVFSSSVFKVPEYFSQQFPLASVPVTQFLRSRIRPLRP